MGGKSGDDSAMRYQMGYDAFDPNREGTLDTNDQYYQAGHDAAAADYQQQLYMESAMQELIASLSQPAVPSYNPVTDENASYADLVEYFGGTEAMDQTTQTPFTALYWTTGEDGVGSWMHGHLADIVGEEDVLAYNLETGESVGEAVTSRNSLYQSYLDAGSRATEVVNDILASQAANAAILGIDFDISDEEKMQMINDEFANFWDTERQSEIERLFDTYGTPEGFEEFTFVLGNPENTEEEEVTDNEDAQANRRKGPGAVGLLEDEEETAVISFLGG